jgi:hypothetical protein
MERGDVIQYLAGSARDLSHRIPNPDSQVKCASNRQNKTEIKITKLK